MKKILFVLTCIALTLLCACGNAQSVNVKVEIDVTDILSNYEMLDEALRDEKYVPADGMILTLTDVELKEGDGALDALKAVAKANNIQIDVSDGYAKGINYIYEKSCGSMSGWVYEVNGESIMSEYYASEGDTITWKYICDFSKMSFE